MINLKIESKSASAKFFDIRDRRLMVSLGPLTPTKYCTYSCSFCYLHSKDFSPYIGLEIPEIILWIKSRLETFDVIYVSGDTDTFAPPRTDKGIELLTELSKLNKDLLFTTRALFDSKQLHQLSKINERQNINKKLFIACISISQLNHSHLEPKPIPSPQQRFNQLNNLKDLGITTVLALRPFLPIIPFEDYKSIIDQSNENIDLILGSDWYADKAGILESKVFLNQQNHFEYVESEMDFDSNEATWKVFKSDLLVKRITEYCFTLNKPFFMRSGPAIDWFHRSKSG